MENRNFAVLIAVFALFGLLFPSGAGADERSEPIDVIIALDKSLSMVEEIDAVKDYVNGYLIDELLIPGDFFLVVAFYGQTEVPVSMTVQGPADKDRAKAIISGLLADGRFTDIGNALDALGGQIERYSRPEREKFLLLITDGIQEAPPESPYYSPDGSFNHAFLENTKVIQKMGWKVHILGIGTHEAAAQLADELAGTYIGISDEPTKDEIVDKTKEFLSALQVSSGPTLGPVDHKGRSRLTLSVESKGYLITKSVEVTGATLAVAGEAPQNILPEPLAFTIEPGATLDLEAALRVPSPPAGGDYRGTLTFDFAGQDRFLPVVADVRFHVNSFVENFWIWLVVCGAALILLIVLLILLVPRLKKLKHRFRLTVQGQKAEKGGEVHLVKEGTPLYLDLSEGRLLVGRQKSPDSLARLVAVAKGVRLTVLKGEHFPKLKEPPLNILDFDFVVRTNMERRTDTGVRLASVK